MRSLPASQTVKSTAPSAVWAELDGRGKDKRPTSGQHGREVFPDRRQTLSGVRYCQQCGQLLSTGRKRRLHWRISNMKQILLLFTTILRMCYLIDSTSSVLIYNVESNRKKRKTTEWKLKPLIVTVVAKIHDCLSFICVTFGFVKTWNVEYQSSLCCFFFYYFLHAVQLPPAPNLPPRVSVAPTVVTPQCSSIQPGREIKRQTRAGSYTQYIRCISAIFNPDLEKK